MGAKVSLGAFLLVSCCWMVIGSGPAEASAEEERFQWRGQVDGVDEILIRGSSIRINHLEAKPIQRQDHRFSAPLPSREVHLKLKKIKGRGDVRLIEEPSSWNDYTAVVRIDDAKQMGDDYYEPTRVAGAGEKTVIQTKIKLADKRRALYDLGRHLAMFTDRRKTDGLEDTLAKMTDDQLARFQAELERGLDGAGVQNHDDQNATRY